MRIVLRLNEGQVSSVTQNLAALHAGFIPLLAESMGAWAQDTAGWIRESELSGQVLRRKTGALASSVIATPPEVAGGRIAVQIQPGFGDRPLVYARIHELGGIIVAKNVQYLRFKTDDGRWHFKKQVVIPARPYMRPAFIRGRPILVAQLEKTLEDFILGQ